MPKYAANPEPVQRIKTLPDLVAYLRDELGWPISPDTVADDLTFDWLADELRLAGGHGARLQGGAVRQLRSFVPGQPWGIFLVEFADTQVYRTSLRQILRGLVPGRRRDPSLQSWQHENLLFICATADYERFTFAHFKGDQVHRAKLATFGWRKGSAYLRTLIEHNLPYLAWPKDDGADPKAWQSEWARAFDKEPVTKKFFADFNNTFRKTCNDIANRHSRWSKETVEREAQTLLNRLLFLYFIQRKGWLNRNRQYLVNQFRECYRKDPTGISFLKDFLQPLFVKLSTKGPQADIPGHDLPFLNGGLFADEYGSEQRDDEVRRHHELNVGNDTFQHIFDDLLEAYNFTVREDTPLDVDVAIDPEMLGKIFESLVLQLERSEVGGKSSRHDTGSYYTPRPIVHYLCRDALAAWLADQPPFKVQGSEFKVQGSQSQASQSRIDDLLSLDASQGLDETARATLNSLLTPDQARALADALQELRACDLAVGSGAFPVALLHELVNVARLAETRARGKDPATNDPRWLFDTKTRFIERVLYGVDIQARAIEICKLRLWLSLVVDYPLDVDVDTCEKHSFRDSLKRLPALPNLDFKIRRANSLIDTIHGEPVPLGKLHAGAMARLPLNRLIASKREFYCADSVPEKRKLRFAIYEATAELAQIELTAARTDLGLIPHPENAEKVVELDQGQKAMAKVLGQIRDARKMKAADQDDALERIQEFFNDEQKPTFVWQLDFAEVFHREPAPALTAILPLPQGEGWGEGKRDGPTPTLSGAPANLGGFDLIVGNPPYVRQEKIKEQKPLLENAYECYTGVADLYVYFYERGVRLLGQGGVLSFISSNKFFRAAYGEKLRAFLRARTELQTVIDFGDLPVFEATAYPCIIVASNRAPNPAHEVRTLNVRTTAELARFAELASTSTALRAQTSLSDAAWQLESPPILRLLEKLRGAGRPLREYVGSRVYRGITTGFNQAFVVDRATRDRLIADAKSSAGVLKPYLRGRDVKRWRAESQSQWLIFTRKGSSIKTLPAIEKHLSNYKEHLLPGAPGGRKPGTYKWFEIQDNIAYWREFTKPKIVSTKVSIRPTFAFDEDGHYLGNTSYFFPATSDGLYLLGLLNSALFHTYAKKTFVEKQGGWYEIQPNGLESFPIPTASAADRASIEKLAQKCLAAHGANCQAWESEINERVYRLYGLTAEEIKIVEEALR